MWFTIKTVCYKILLCEFWQKEARKMDQDLIKAIVIEGIGELNKLLMDDEQIALEGTAVLHGENGALDSMSIINLTIILEELMLERHGVEILLAEHINSADPKEVFKSIDSLSLAIKNLCEIK